VKNVSKNRGKIDFKLKALKRSNIYFRIDFSVLSRLKGCCCLGNGTMCGNPGADREKPGADRDAL
jgi:hypothetical protein